MSCWRRRETRAREPANPDGYLLSNGLSFVVCPWPATAKYLVACAFPFGSTAPSDISFISASSSLCNDDAATRAEVTLDGRTARVCPARLPPGETSHSG